MSFHEVAVVVARESLAVFVLITKACGGDPVSRDAVVGLRIGGAAGFVVRRDFGISSRVVEDGLSRDAVSVRTSNRDDIAKIVAKAVRIRLSGRTGIDVYRIELTERESHEIVPARGGLILKGGTDIGIVVALGGIVGDAIQQQPVRRTEIGPVAPIRYTHAGSIRRCPTEIPGHRRVMEEIVGVASRGVEAREQREVIELMKRTGERCRLEVRSEVSAIRGELQLRN